MDTFAEVFHGAVRGIGALSRAGQLTPEEVKA
jgi:hypothetical protein